MKPERATFQIRDADASPFDTGSVMIDCEIEWDATRKEWRAWDEHDTEAWSEWKPLAAARLFVARMEGSR
jgi:hypothetical protein